MTVSIGGATFTQEFQRGLFSPRGSQGPFNKHNTHFLLPESRIEF